jgi:hypothetical protein
MADKLAALTLLAKHLKLFTEKVEASVDAKASVEGARETIGIAHSDSNRATRSAPEGFA